MFSRAAKAESKALRPAQPAKKSSPNKEKRLARLEKEIAALEKQIADIEALEQENASDYQKLMELGEQKNELDEKLTAAYESWEAIADE